MLLVVSWTVLCLLCLRPVSSREVKLHHRGRSCDGRSPRSLPHRGLHHCDPHRSQSPTTGLHRQSVSGPNYSCRMQNMLSWLINCMIQCEVMGAHRWVQGVAPSCCGECCIGARPGAGSLRDKVEGWWIIAVLAASPCPILYSAPALMLMLEQRRITLRLNYLQEELGHPLPESHDQH